jgi:hypothetical protein
MVGADVGLQDAIKQSLMEIGLAIPRAWRFSALQGSGYGYESELWRAGHSHRRGTSKRESGGHAHFTDMRIQPTTVSWK